MANFLTYEQALYFFGLEANLRREIKSDLDAYKEQGASVDLDIISDTDLDSLLNEKLPIDTNTEDDSNNEDEEDPVSDQNND